MARMSPYVFRFLLLSLLLPTLLALVGWLYYDDVRSKSFYYRLVSSNLAGHLDGGELTWQDETLTLRLATRDSLITCDPFTAKRYHKARYDFHRLNGEPIALGVPFDSLSPYMKRVMRKIPELGLREMRSPAPGQLQFRIGDDSWLYYTNNPETAASLTGKVRKMDPNWYVLDEAP
jgi:hypothetical protein